MPGTYVTGWIKRGARGVIGTNKLCAQETVTQLLDDLAADKLSAPQTSATQVYDLITSRVPRVLGKSDWTTIDAAEVERGRMRGRPRSKFTTRAALIASATGPEGAALPVDSRPAH